MTQENNPKTDLVPVAAPVDEFEVRAKATLSKDDYEKLMVYKSSGKPGLATSTSMQMFELFLNGSDMREIHSTNKAIPYESILWARIKDKWDAQRDTYILELQNGIRDRVQKAQLEAAGLLSDLITVANKQFGGRINRFLQTGDDKELAGVPKLESLQAIVKAVEGLQKITGQDKTVNVKREETLNVNVRSQIGADTQLSTEDAAQILSIVANSKRKAEKDEKNR